MVEDGAYQADPAEGSEFERRYTHGLVSVPGGESDDRQQGERGALKAETVSSVVTRRIAKREAETSNASESSRAASRGKRAANRTTKPAHKPSDLGRVSLVGAGPGHPDLLTKRAYDRLAAADVVLYDTLTTNAVLEDLPKGVEVVDVGKRPPNRTSQTEINALLCERSKQGEHVVRLKGGDPCLFGRGGEETEHLASEGIPFEVVPGVSSALAAPGISAIPLTHREHASSVTVITGHETPEKAESALDWDALARTVATGGTLVILMGVARLPENVDALVDHGVPPETPAATIQKATWHDEETVVASVGTIAKRNERAGIESPAVTIVGDVVSVREAVEPSLHR
ncbi:uroporphyrinogen-III C-methyltransferase [Halobacteriales archaeon QH_6_64_20]|jgi:uroporphyrin-III C-methyltransferase|nr:MAG: uroporphyrinogen-III C-methyltransferase [Halobacteriales archaeon QH_6_64_20]